MSLNSPDDQNHASAITNAIDSGATDAFVDYYQSVGDRADANDCLEIIHQLMTEHGTGNDWWEAWPIDVYLSRGATFDTPPGPEPRSAQQELTRVFPWCLCEFKTAQAQKDTLIALSEQFHTSKTIAAVDGLHINIPFYDSSDGISPEEYMQTMIAHMANVVASL